MSHVAARSRYALLFLALWLILLIAGRSAMFRDPGTLWHVAAGEKMLAAGQVIREDPFSFTEAGKPWVADQWLAECAMAAVHRVAGWDGLLLATASLLAAIYAWIAARLLRGGLHVLPTVLLIAVAMMLGSPQFHVRPLVVTIVLLGVSFGWLVDVETGNRRFRHLWWLVPMFLLWANMHGGVLGGIGTVAICLAGWCVLPGARTSRPRSQIAASVTLLIALAAMMFISPYGLAMPREWLDTLAMPLPHFIVEHARLDPAEPIGWATLALGVVYLAVLVGVLPGWPRITWLVPLVWFLLAILRVRNAPLFGVTAAIALADMLPYSRIGRWLERRDLLVEPSPPAPLPMGEGRRGTEEVVGTTSATKQNVSPTTSSVPFRRRDLAVRLLPFVVIATAALLQVGNVHLPIVGRGWARFDPAVCPVDLLPALDEINRSSPDGTHIFNDMNFGGFLIYHAPRLRVFVDDRCPLYGSEFLFAYDRARREDPPQIDRWRRQYGFDYALVEAGGQFDRYLASPAGWTLVQRCDAAALYRHEWHLTRPSRQPAATP